MSFAATVDQVRQRRKTVTRRMGWAILKPGDRLVAVERARGVRVGDRVELATIEVVDVRRERLDAITAEDCAAEGFPELTPADFVQLFARLNGLKGEDVGATFVTRIRFRYVGGA